MVPSSFRPEGPTLPNDVPAYFELFYRATIRRVIGRRLRSSDLLATYLAWAGANDAPAINFHQLRRYMRAIGHDRAKSNGIRYLDAAFACDLPNTPDSYRIVPLHERMPADTIDLAVAAIDEAMTALRQVRVAIVGASA